jgi:hypothetical protein
MPTNPALRRLNQKVLGFKASVGYIGRITKAELTKLFSLVKNGYVLIIFF